MKYEKSKAYNTPLIMSRIMGPNPVKLTEELMTGHRIPKNALVMDLGCGQGVTSLFLAKEYGFRVYATDLWIAATENMRFFTQMGLTRDQIVPIHADAVDLPYADEFFDAVVTVDSYHYFGRDPAFLGEKLLPLVRHGGLIYIAIPGMKKDCHDDLPPELLLSWRPEDLDTMHDAAYWRALIEKTAGVNILSIHEMESNEEVWADWLRCDNPYAVGDRLSMNAGAGKYFNFIAMVLQRA